MNDDIQYNLNQNLQTPSTDPDLIRQFYGLGKELPPEKRVAGLMKKTKALMRSRKEFLPLKEYLLFLEGQNGVVKIYENIPSGQYDYKCGDSPAILILDETKLKTMQYGDSTVRGWWANEKYAFPYPHDTRHDSVQLERLVRRYQAIMEDYEAKTLKGWGMMLLYIGLAIALIAFVYFKWGQPDSQIIYMMNQSAMVPIN